MTLLKAIRVCVKLRNKPLCVKHFGNRVEFNLLDNPEVFEYNYARETIRKFPRVEKLIRRWI